MKGGGGIILIFLFVCFVWGINSVVAAIRRVFGPRSNQEVDVLTKAWGALGSEIIGRIRQASDLHKAGILSDDEFQKHKDRLIRGAD